MIRAWQGLGYNRRAVSLHAAAQHVAEHGWPDDLTALPGVGPYTADAVARFAFGAPALPADVNVQARERAHRLSSSRTRAAAALMDLGATICLARVPRCGRCPLARSCPSRGQRFEPLRKQSAFEGSFRQRRSRTLRQIAEAPQLLDGLDRGRCPLAGARRSGEDRRRLRTSFRASSSCWRAAGPFIFR